MRKPQNIIGTDMVMLAEFDKICDRRCIATGFIAGNLYLMITDGCCKFTLTFIMVNTDIYHTLYHAISPPLY